MAQTDPLIVLGDIDRWLPDLGSGSCDDASGGEGQHEAGESAEKHADAYEGADGPDGAVRPVPPDHDGEEESDDAVEDKPAGALAGTGLEAAYELEDALEYEPRNEEKGE